MLEDYFILEYSTLDELNEWLAKGYKLQGSCVKSGTKDIEIPLTDKDKANIEDLRVDYVHLRFLASEMDYKDLGLLETLENFRELINTKQSYTTVQLYTQALVKYKQRTLWYR